MTLYSAVIVAVWVVLGGAGASLLVWRFLRDRRTGSPRQAAKRLAAGVFAVVVLLVGITLLMGQFWGIILGGGH